jgi:hypothetical protein
VIGQTDQQGTSAPGVLSVSESLRGNGAMARAHLLELAEEQDKKIAAVKSRSEIWPDVRGHG